MPAGERLFHEMPRNSPIGRWQTGGSYRGNAGAQNCSVRPDELLHRFLASPCWLVRMDPVRIRQFPNHPISMTPIHEVAELGGVNGLRR